MDYDGNLRLYSLDDTNGSWRATWATLQRQCDVHGVCGRYGVRAYQPLPAPGLALACSCPEGFVAGDASDWSKGCRREFHVRCGEPVYFAEMPSFDFNYTPGVSMETCRNMCLNDCNCEAFGYRMTAGECYPKIALWNGRTSASKQNIFLKVPASLKCRSGTPASSAPTSMSGTVYRGVLEDARSVAVKRLDDLSQADEVFRSELSVIGRINHVNLVRMWGFCSEHSNRLLENGSLDKALFVSNGGGGGESVLGWRSRYRIAAGVARGLAYLHRECLEWIVHCDVKPERTYCWTRSCMTSELPDRRAAACPHGHVAAAAAARQLARSTPSTCSVRRPVRPASRRPRPQRAANGEQQQQHIG
ncbi:putative receptor protein kinase ZmPK1 [Miscanthus floridulus]|uniref:putative receptor protein kinase ZmPK1 n=1 Tax=Miscanthus floridulus TaxID=154761 RepID=UPI00345A1078